MEISYRKLEKEVFTAPFLLFKNRDAVIISIIGSCVSFQKYTFDSETESEIELVYGQELADTLDKNVQTFIFSA